jgi:hypothetical protein
LVIGLGIRFQAAKGGEVIANALKEVKSERFTEYALAAASDRQIVDQKS